jgi:chromosome partitioning protein
MRTILVVNPKGGCGKTTVATNLASYYALWGLPTALIDCDPQKSSLEWLAQRPAGLNPITGVDASHGRLRIPERMQRVVLDAPARSTIHQVGRLAADADVVLIPVLPSPIDMRAAAHFVGELLLDDVSSGKQIGLVANRVREYTQVYHRLELFLRRLGIPFVTHLRDSQNYIRAAERGIGVLELAPSYAEREVDQWRPLIKWVEKGRRR